MNKEEHIKKFKKSGFVQIKNFFKPTDIEKIRDLIYKIGFDEKKSDIYYDETNKQKKIRRVEKLSREYLEIDNLAYDKLLSEYLFAIFNEKAVIFKEKLNFKPSNGLGNFRMHIDGHYDWVDDKNNKRKGWSEYGRHFVNVVIPIEKSNRDNGCLYVCDKNETLNVFGNNWDEIKSKLDGPGPYLKKEDEAKINKIYIEQEPTDLLLFDWMCAHGSDNNYSENERPILYLTYNGISDGENLNKYYFDKKNSQGSIKDKSLDS